jgi:CheY-like chemotaxis protein
VSKPIKVAVFDDVLAARREVFHIPGLDIGVFSHADDVCAICHGDAAPDVVCMDYAMGAQHASGEDAIRAVRSMGYGGHIVAMSSDPAANAAMIAAGADEALQQKAMLRSYLVALGRGEIQRRGAQGGFAALRLLVLIGGVGAIVLGLLCLGPWGYGPRAGVTRLEGRVLDQGATPSQLDGAPVLAEAIGVWAKDGKAFSQVAGASRLGALELPVAAGGERWTVVADRDTQWLLADGPAKRVRTPGDIPAGQGLPGWKTMRYVARGPRVVAGQLVTVDGVVVGTNGGERRLLAQLVADEGHRGRLGPDLAGSPMVQLGGVVLLGMGVALLATRG